MPIAYWVHEAHPFLGPHWGNFGVRIYGLAYILGFVIAAWLLARYAKRGRSRVPADRIGDLMMWCILGVMVGGRLGYYLLYDGWRRFPEDPLEIFRYWDGGMASHGGFMGVLLGLWWFARSQGFSFLHVGDLVASTVSAGMFLVRLANFNNGELWGRVTTVPWAVIFPRSATPGMPVELILPRHPSQLYEAGLEGALLFAYMQWRFWRSDVVARHPGRLGGEFLAIYGVVRIFGEMFREPDASLILGMSRGTFYSVFLIAAGVALILRKPKAVPA